VSAFGFQHGHINALFGEVSQLRVSELMQGEPAGGLGKDFCGGATVWS
jgi:hypothetical protein